MAVDLQQLQRIHSLQAEVAAAETEVKTLVQDYVDHLDELPEQQAVTEAEQVLKEARERLRIAVTRDADLARLADKIDEAKYQRHDLNEILSHHLVAYHDVTGRDVIKDRESQNRQIEFKAKLGKPALDQPKLPFSQHIGQRIEIATPDSFAKRFESPIGDME